MRSREICWVGEGLLHSSEVTGKLHMHLLARDMIPIAALVIFALLRYCSDVF